MTSSRVAWVAILLFACGQGDAPDPQPVEEEAEAGPAGSSIAERRLSLPEVGGRAEMVEGSVVEICGQVAASLREKGGLS